MPFVGQYRYGDAQLCTTAPRKCGVTDLVFRPGHNFQVIRHTQRLPCNRLVKRFLPGWSAE